MEQYIYNTHNPVFQIDNPIVKEAYNNLNNYLIINNANQHQKNDRLCVIYFSGHSIYYPNNIECFTKEILLKDRYEWFGIRIKNAAKYIYLRDIHKQWYLTGINSKLSSPEKLYDFLKKETEGYRVLCIGSSAGGYAALLYGSLLKAEIIYAFSPQIELESSLILTNETIDPLVFRLKNTELRRYFDITQDIELSNSKIIVCLPTKSEWDIREFNYLKNTNILNKSNFHLIKFNTNKHGVPFPKVALESFFTSCFHKFNYNDNIIYNPLKFSIQLVGLRKTLNGSIKQIKKYYFAKVRSIYNNIQRKLYSQSN